MKNSSRLLVVLGRSNFGSERAVVSIADALVCGSCFGPYGVVAPLCEIARWCSPSAMCAYVAAACVPTCLCLVLLLLCVCLSVLSVYVCR